MSPLAKHLPAEWRATWFSNQLFELFNYSMLTHVGPTRRAEDPSIIDLYILRPGGSGGGGCNVDDNDDDSGTRRKEEVVSCAYDMRAAQFVVVVTRGGTNDTAVHQRFEHWDDVLNLLWRIVDVTRELVDDDA